MNYIERLTKDEYLFFLKQYKEELVNKIREIRSDYFWANNSFDQFITDRFPKLVKQVEEYKSVTKKIAELEEKE